MTIAACSAQIRGDLDRARAGFSEAASGFDAVDMAMHAAAARLRLGELIGGDEGDDLVRAAREWMASQEIANPERMTDMLATCRG